MTVEEIKKEIKESELCDVYEMFDMGIDNGYVDVLVLDVFPEENVKKALKELGIKKYRIHDDNSVTYTIYA